MWHGTLRASGCLLLLRSVVVSLLFGTMDLDADSFDDTLLPPVTKPDRALGKFQPKARPKVVKTAAAPKTLPNSDQPIPTTLGPPVASPEPKCPDEKLSSPASQRPVTQPEGLDLEPSAPSNNNEVTSQRDHEREASDLFFHSESLDLTLSPPTKGTFVGKFEPKPKAQHKDEKLVTTSTDAPGYVNHQKASHSDDAVYNSNKVASHYVLEKLQTISFPILESFPDDNQRSLTTDVQESLGASNACSEGLSSTLILSNDYINKEALNAHQDRATLVEYSQDVPQVSESDTKLHSHPDEPGEMAMNMLSNVGSFEDAFFHSGTSSVKQVGKFKPKLIPRPKEKEDKRVSSNLPDSAETIDPPLNSHMASLHNEGTEVLSYSNTEVGSSFLQMMDVESFDNPQSVNTIPGCNEDSNMIHGYPGEKDTSVLLGLESLENIISQPTASTARPASKFQPKPSSRVKNVKPAVPLNGNDVMESLHPQRDPLPMESESYVPVFPTSSLIDSFTTGTLNTMPTDSTCEQGYHVDTSLEVVTNNDHTIKRDQISTVPFLNSLQTQQSQEKMSSFETVEDGGTSKSTRKRRKRKIVSSPRYEKVNNDLGFDSSNGPPTDDVNNDDENRGEEVPIQKKVTRKAKKQINENEKPVRKRKKASEEPSSTAQKPMKRKFPHATRRKRRQVSKALLEMPEDEIDPMQLSIKDLIMLAEAKEKIASKEATESKKDIPVESNNYFEENSHYDDDNYFETDEQYHNLDGDETNNNVQLSSRKLNYHSFMKRSSSRWLKSETESFYRAIQQFGTDFAMIQKLFPNRTRHQIKLKFKSEDRKHPLQVADALTHRTKDHSHFELVIEQLRKEAEEKARDEATYDPTSTSWDAAAENENMEEHGQPDKEENQDGGFQSPAKSNDWGGEFQTPGKFDEYEDEDLFRWDANASSPQDMDKVTYNDF